VVGPGDARLVCSLMPGNPLTDPNWASDTTNKIVRVVSTVRDQTTTKAVFAARAIVFGIIAAFLGTFILVISVIGLMRGLQALLDIAVSEPRSVYLSYFVVGGILCGFGLFLFKKRNAASS
jgi:hypothetical protein